MWYFNLVMSELCFTKEEMISALESVTFEKLLQIIPELFAKMHVEGLVYGNVTAKKASLMMDQVEAVLRSIKTEPADVDHRFRLVKLEKGELCVACGDNHTCPYLLEGCDLVYHRENEVHKSSSVTSYYQTTGEDAKCNVLLELFEQIINEPCFDILRTKEQLGRWLWVCTRISASGKHWYSKAPYRLAQVE